MRCPPMEPRAAGETVNHRYVLHEEENTCISNSLNSRQIRSVGVVAL